MASRAGRGTTIATLLGGRLRTATENRRTRRSVTAMAPDRTRMVGRGEQLAFFEARLDDVLRRDGSTTLFYGEPGIGKTRLLRAWTGAARVRGFKIGAATNYPFARDAYASIAEACRILAQGEPRAQPRDAADRALFVRFLGLFAPETDAREAETAALRHRPRVSGAGLGVCAGSPHDRRRPVDRS